MVLGTELEHRNQSQLKKRRDEKAACVSLLFQTKAPLAYDVPIMRAREIIRREGAWRVCVGGERKKELFINIHTLLRHLKGCVWIEINQQVV